MVKKRSSTTFDNTVENTEQGLNLVNNKQAYAFIGNLLTTSHYIAKTGKLNIRVVGDTPYRNDLAIAVRSDWPIFTGILQKALDSIPQSQKDAIYHEWISVRYEKSFDYFFLWKILTGVALMFLIFSFWNWKLSKEIKQRKLIEKKLKKAKECADQANEAKSRFISSMSHELRTPLNAVLGYSQLLQLDDMSREAVKEYSLETLNAGKHLLDLINDILDLAHIESDLVDINIEAVDIIAVLITSISLVESLAKENNISLSLKDSKYTNAYALVDKVRIKQVILNLLSNAIKYNNENGSVTVSIEDSDAKNLTVKITDTGSGLSEENISLLYEPFNRLGAENSNIQGTGIGLTITRQLIEKMNGSISVNSSPGVGTTFSINLLRAPSSSRTENHKEIGVHMKDIRNSTMKILYVEDAISNQKLLKAIMDRRANISLTTVSSAESAIDLIKENNPDLILLDIDLPGMNGYEFFEHIQSIESYKSIPVIAITAKAMVDDIEKAKKYAFTAYLTKPIIINKLFNAIKPFTK